MAITCVESVSVKHQFDRPRLKNMGFSGDSDGKEYACNAGDLHSIPGLGRSPGEGNINAPQDSPGESHG